MIDQEKPILPLCRAYGPLLIQANPAFSRTTQRVLLVALLYCLGYALYFHVGAPDRSMVDSYNASQVALTNKQFGSLGEVPQDRATLVKFYNDEKWLRFGESIFKTNCQSCHGAEGGGLVGPNLTDDRWKNIQHLDDIIRVINVGAGGNAMPAWKDKLDPRKITIVSAYVASLLGKKPTVAKGPDGANVIASWDPDIQQVPVAERHFVRK